MIYNNSVVNLFETVAEKYPNQTAVIYLNQKYTYAELNQKANQIAHWLVKKSIKEGDFIALLLEPSIEFIVSMIAIVKIGCAYVPLDAHAPKLRIKEIIKDAQPKLIITEAEFQEIFLENNFQFYLIDHILSKSIQYSSKKNINIISPDSPIYMIYTSGSTGKPKGVVIPHKAVVNLTIIDNIICIKIGEKIGQYCNLAFDGSIFEIWVALLNGATLCIIPNEDRRNHILLKKTINQYNLKYLLIPTGYFHQLIKSYPDTLDNLHTISFGGEQVNLHLLKEFIQYRKNLNVPTKLINVYGPTEATVFSCCNIIHTNKAMNDEQLASIGFKTCNTETYILDENGLIANEGELFVSGVHLALSYHDNSPHQTNDKFIKNPFSTDKTFEKIYRTGDRVKLLPSGELLYLGRIDDQVKIGGFRIHLNEIEYALMRHNAISLAAVTVEIGGGTHKLLTAYIVFNKENVIIQADKIRDFLGTILPYYMLPAKYVMVKKLPLTAVGKVDRSKLDKILHVDLSFHMDVSSSSIIEETIKNIWRHLLNRIAIDSNKNLFDLGANSLLITEACSRINDKLQSELLISDILAYPTIHKLSQFLEGKLDKIDTTRRKKIFSSDIAIIGMSCRFPQADSIDKFWENLCAGKDCLSRFDEKSSPLTSSEKYYVPVRGILSNIDKFDANFFGFSPIDAKITDPQHRIFLECTWEALEHAGVAPSKSGGKLISLFAGMTDSAYLQENLLKNHWFNKTHDFFDQRISTSSSMLSTQTSYRLDLKGRSVNVNTACSTGLVAVDYACQDLILGQSDIALAGTSSIVTPEIQGYFYQQGSILSPDGFCRPFSKDANGTVFSNGVGIVVLKRLEDAITDHDTIFAVIKGRGLNNDGIDKLGFTAPSTRGQMSCIKDALNQANINPEKISFIETHGTATALGDLIEINALNSVYQQHTSKKRFCALGSVKANIGHTDVTAGIASIIKTALCLYHKKIPPLIHFKEPNPELHLSDSPFFVNTQMVRWEESTRLAGVSAFGVGGTNAHMILSSYEKNKMPDRTTQKEELILVSSKTENALDENILKFHQYFQTLKNPNQYLSDLAFTLHTAREDFVWRKFTVGNDFDQISESLKNKNPTFCDAENNYNLVFMFSGQGMQYPQMAMDLFNKLPRFAKLIMQGVTLARQYLDCDLLTILNTSKAEKIHKTEYAQPALFIIEYALSKILIDCGIKPKALIGHSLGEYVAACIAGVFSFEDAIALICHRGLLMAQSSRGGMIALETTQEEIYNYQKVANISISLHNSINSFVLSGNSQEIALLEKHLISLQKPFLKLNVNHPFHSTFMRSIEKPFKNLFTEIKLSPPSIPIVSNVTGDWLSALDAIDPDYWYKHLCHPVQFTQSIYRLLQDKRPLFIEIGPGHSLCRFVKEISQGKADVTFTLPSHHRKQSDIYQLLSTFGELWSKGVHLDLSFILDYENSQHIPLPTYSFQRQSYWLTPDIISKKIHDFKETYRQAWSQIHLITEPPKNLKNFEFLIFKDNTGIADKLIALLLNFNIQPFVIEASSLYQEITPLHIRINPKEKKHYFKLINYIKDKLRSPIIYHFFSLLYVGEDYYEEHEINEKLDYVFYSPLYLIQAILDEIGSMPTHLTICTKDSQNILGTEKICPINTTSLGISRVLPLEHPSISCNLSDFSFNENDTTILEYFIDSLSSSITKKEKNTSELHAYRSGLRWEMSFSPNTKLTTIERLSDNGVYLITGGLGGIGLEICKSIVNTVKNPTFILCSRNTIISETEWSVIANNSAHPLYLTVLSLLELKNCNAKIIPYQIDMSVFKQVQLLIDFCTSKFDKLNGVIHAAGIPGGGLLQLKSKSMSHQVFLPKIHATYNLAKATKHLELDFVVLMSSVAAITGEKGQVDYCGANACLDAFAYSRLFNSKFIVSINWNTWEKVGMSVQTKRPDEINLFERENNITPQEGQQLFLQILRSQYSNTIVSNYSIEEYANKVLTNGDSLAVSEESKISRDVFNNKNDYIAPQNQIQQHLAEIWQNHLHIKAISLDDNFFNLGGHSLKALSLIDSINTKFGTRLSVQHLYQSPSIGKLSILLKETSLQNVNILVPLKNSCSSEIPFFFCHPASGMLYCFKDITNSWDFSIPMYGLQDPSISSHRLIFDSIYSMASTYLEAIRTIQPKGPYYLVGYSLGGTIMYEIAHILKQQGQSIGLLSLIDSWCIFSDNQKSKPYFLENYLPIELQKNHSLAELTWARMELLINHKPSPSNQNLLLFKAKDMNTDYTSINDVVNGWSKFTSGNIKCHIIKASHDTIVSEGGQFILKKIMDYKDSN